MAKLEYYKCNIIGGFRLSDLNQQVKQDEVIDVDEHIANTSKAVQAALKAGWLVKVKKPKAKKEDIIKDEKKEKPPKSANKSLGMSVPDAKTVNKSLETRQAEDIAQKVSSPDMKGNKKPKTLEPQTGVSIPDIQQVQRNVRDRQKENLNNKDQIIKTTILKQEDTIEKLAKNENMDEGLSVPNFDEKADDQKNEDVEGGQKSPATIRRKRTVTQEG